MIGRSLEAIQLLERLLKICTECYSENHPFTAAAINSLAILYKRSGELAKARHLYNSTKNSQDLIW